MPRIERAVLIRAGSQEVFAFISDFRNDGRWRRFVQEVEHRPPGLAWLGTKVRESMLVLGLRVRSEAEVVEYEQDRRVATSAVSGALGLSTRREVKPQNGHCRCTISLELQPQGVFRVLGRPLRIVLQRRLVTDLLRLREVLEHPEAGQWHAPATGGPGRVSS